MATLKFRGDRGFGWIANVQTVEVGERWTVQASDFGHPSVGRPESGFGPGWNVIDHGLPPTESYDGSINEEREEWDAVELLVVSDHPPAQDGRQYAVHVVSAGECWLMGDDGRTIDRIL